ncbi:hypothetical protein RRG08_023630 [Elysia crispata]|uniref:ABC-type glutathione-S-conjugate transporter n=1 Tax=Elysia crispata TaxID=231223 RepID=A0AAE0XSH1_9GAST|nr:hypothetical protein RRG08_023630 [Elysia crispata]
MVQMSFEEFCGSEFWNSSLLLDGPYPEFTDCFRSTLLQWLPCAYMWILFPYFLRDVKNGNNLNKNGVIPQVSRTNGVKSSSNGHAPRGTRIENGTQYADEKEEKGKKTKFAEDYRSMPQRGDITALCCIRVILSLMLAVISLAKFIGHLGGDHDPPSFSLGAALYLCTYILVAFEVWYEKRNNHNQMFMVFYFTGMNSLLDIIPIYTGVYREQHLTDLTGYTLMVCDFVLNVLLFCLTFWPENALRRRGYQSMDKEQCPEPTSPYPFRLFFIWMQRLILDGFKRDLRPDDIWNLNPRDNGKTVNPKFETIWQDENNRINNINATNFPELFTPRDRDGKVHPLHGSKRRRIRHAVRYDSAFSERTSLMGNEDMTIGGAAEVSTKDKELQKPNLFWALFILSWRNFLAASIQKLLADIALYINPVVLGALITRLQYPDRYPEWQAYCLSVSLLVFGLMKSILVAHSFYRGVQIGIHTKTALTAAIYKKALTITSWAKKKNTVGEIVNLMSVDCQRLEDVLAVYIFMASSPFQIIIGIALLYNTVGVSVLPAILLLLLLIPLNTWIANYQKELQDKVLRIKDGRIKMVNEILSGMKVLKLYAWEDEFKRKVAAIRQSEVNILYRISTLYTVAGVCWTIAPFLVTMVTFTTYVLSDRNNVLDPETAFVALALLNLLRTPMAVISTFITFTVQIMVSVKRIQKFLILEDLDPANVDYDTQADNAIRVKKADFTWDRDSKPTLQGINFTVPVGSLTAIVGPVGSGKTSLISAVLGEMERLKGSVLVKYKAAYVSQQAWIQNATVRDNILFGSRYNKKRYERVIAACELKRDFEILEAGDQTEIGEKGINLSGGQKQRVNLARAVYSQADLYLLDDPLSAVDAHVGKAIFKNVVGNEGLLAKKTRVLVTHGVHWLPMVDNILVLSNGKISEQGSYQALLTRDGPFAHFLREYFVNANDADDTEPGMDEEDKEDRETEQAMKDAVERLTSEANTSADEAAVFWGYEARKRKRRHITRTHSTSESRELRPSRHTEEDPLLASMQYLSTELSVSTRSAATSHYPEQGTGKLITEEKLETGRVKRGIFLTYARAAGVNTLTIGLLSFFLSQAFFVWSSFFLTTWTEDELLLNATTRSTPEGARRTDYYVGVNGGFFGITQLLTLIGFNFLFWRCLVRAAEKLHGLLLERLFHAPMSFFDQTPIGRILNRFSRDVDTVDNTLPLILRDFLITGCIILTTLIVILIKSPVFGAVLIPIVIVFMVIQNYYVRTSRQLKRIESIARSPIYVHFSESVTGAAVIRAYGAADRFVQESERRVDRNQVYYFASQAAIRWLQLNMDVLANLVVLFSAIFQITSGGRGSDAGISVSFALQISGALTYMVRQVCEFETNIVSVERMEEYSQVEQEAALIHPNSRPRGRWPHKGDVIFNNFQARYREGLDLVLKGVNCKINGGEKVGIVGRTGAGKSSLTLCLFRIIEAANGSIVIDGINIADIGLHDLRSKLTILPQDPVLFSGSLRMNIDPFDEYSDSELWTALERAHLKTFVSAQPEKLMYECGEEGANLSIGQRQLVCLARSLLRQTQILILDEATAAIDLETDALIQATIRSAFHGSTVLAIAHRLNTIMDYDKIIVMDAGIISEFDSPEKLIAAKGIFYSMCQDAGLAS